MLRVLHLGLGPLGRMIAEQLHRSGIGVVAGAIDPAAAMRGKRLSDVMGDYGSANPTIAGSIDEIGVNAAFDVAIVTTASDLPACAPTFRQLLDRGMAIVSTCEELLFPWLRYRELATELDSLSRRSGGRLLGTGVNPGFLMDTLPVVATGVCTDVRGLLIERVQDATTRRVPFQRKIGAGLSPTEFARRSAEGSLRHVGLGESLHFVAHYLGLRFDAWTESIEPVLTGVPLPCAMGIIQPGSAAGVHQTARGMLAGRDVVRLEFIAAIGQPDPHDRIRVDADPPIDLILRGGVHGDRATTNIVINSLPCIMEATPGLHTMATIRPVRAISPAAHISGHHPTPHILA